MPAHLSDCSRPEPSLAQNRARSSPCSAQLTAAWPCRQAPTLSRWLAPLCGSLTLLISSHASAIDRIFIEAEEISAGDVRARQTNLVLDLTPETPAAQLSVRRLAAPGVSDLRDVRLGCATIVVKEPRFACRDARLTARGGPTGSLAMRITTEYDTDNGTFRWNAAGQQLASGRVSFGGSVAGNVWSLDAQGTSLQLAELRQLAAPWVALSSDFSFTGHVNAQIRAKGRGTAAQARFEGSLAEVSFTNEASTVVGENVGATWRGTLSRTPRGLEFEAELAGNAGQALGGPLFFDLGRHPLKVSASGQLEQQTLRISSFAASLQDVLQARGEARVALAEKPQIEHGQIQVKQLVFPGAYTTFLQLSLAATDFGALRTQGIARGNIEIEANRITRADGQLEKLDIEDDKGKFSMADLVGTVHWVADPQATVQSSQLSWSSGSAYGLSGGAANITLTARADGFELAPGARIPIFDGALVLNAFAVRGLGGPSAELDLDARLEPISMPLLSRAFGWPELSGELSGEIPGVTYRNRELIVQGDLVASVFDGTIVGRGFRLRDPLGPWPRLYADVTARRLDLALVTRTFSIGSITGRLDADIERLELFNWSPVAFDARLYSTPGDRSTRLINQKAITSISSIGGGWSGVPAALQSGVLRFFDNFRYDRIGLTCRLRNEVCLMGGIEPVGSGYYIVRGGGLPRIDIIGNAGRVDWPDLVARIVAGMRSQGNIKVE